MTFLKISVASSSTHASQIASNIDGNVSHPIDKCPYSFIMHSRSNNYYACGIRSKICAAHQDAVHVPSPKFRSNIRL